MKNTTINVKVTLKEKESLQRKADNRGITLSEYVREVVGINSVKGDKEFVKLAKSMIRELQTFKNLLDVGIDVEVQEKNIMRKLDELCVLLK